jgi:hypothetical protein
VGNVRLPIKYTFDVLSPILRIVAAKVGIKIASEYRPLPCGPKDLAITILDAKERPKRRNWAEEFRNESMAKAGR